MDIRKLAAEGRTEEIERQLMDLDSQFSFKCRKCGKCCKHQDTILFNTRDIFNIACKLQLTMEEVINEYAETYIGSASKIPVVHKQVHTVREWLARFGIPEHDEFFLMWSRLTAMLHRMIHELEEHHVSNETLNLFWSAIFSTLYLDYDTSAEFLPQFRQAAEKLSSLCQGVAEVGTLFRAGETN